VVSTGTAIDANHNPDYIVDLTPYFQAHAADITGGQKLAISYKATITADPTAEQAKAINSFDVIKNGVKVKVPPTDPNPDNPGTDTPVDGDTTITINKVDENGAPLNGAVFTLETEDETKIVEVTTGSDGTDGEAKVTNLGAGTYKFVETKAPDGYASYKDLGAQAVVTATTGDTKITMSTVVTALDAPVAGVGLGLSSVKDNVATVKNVKNISQLPLTGAAGVFLFLIVAALLAGGAGTMVMISKRNKKAGMAL
jgi:LPXTG-motif cell wall-anchored protein